MKKLHPIKLQDKLIITFLRYIKDKSDISAVKFINKELDEGKSLKDIFKKEKMFGQNYGYFINVSKLEVNKIKIDFGCHAGPRAGDGGAWEVVFNKDGNVQSCEQVDGWIA